MAAKEADQLFRAEENFVMPLGRTYFLNDTLWMALSGSGAEFRFSGRRAEITLKGDQVALGQTDYARIGIYANGVRVVDDLLNQSQKTYTVFESAAEQDVIIRIVKLSEAIHIYRRNPGDSR